MDTIIKESVPLGSKGVIVEVDESNLEYHSMKKVVVADSTSLLGRAIVVEFTNQKWSVLGMPLKAIANKTIVNKPPQLIEMEKMIRQFKPDMMVYCGLNRFPEKEYFTVNHFDIFYSKSLAKLTREIRCGFIYISTDSVFNGWYPPYNETDETYALNNYGFYKRLGEKEVLEAHPGSIVLRISAVYGGELYIGESYVSQLIEVLMNKKITKFCNSEVVHPSHTSDIAKICFQLSEKQMEYPRLSSIYHWCGREPFTAFEMLKILGEVFSIPLSHVKPNNNQSSLEPTVNNKLGCAMLLNLHIGEHTAFRDGVQDLKKLISCKKDKVKKARNDF